MSISSEEWLIRRIDDKHRERVVEYNVTITVTTTSVIFKDGVKILKKKAAKKTTV
jgi:hypothetical protein